MLYIFYVIGLVVCIVLLKATKAKREKSLQGRTSKTKISQKAEPLGKYKGECLSVDDAKTLAVTIYEKKKTSTQRKFVRLFAVNVARPNEPIGREAKQWLEQQCIGKKIKLVVWEVDSYKRLVGELFVGLNRNLNLEMVKLGYADCDGWVFKDHPEYEKALKAAKEKKLGMWA